MLFGHVHHILIEFNNINCHLREMAVEEPRKRSATQADDQKAKRVLNKSQTRGQNTSVGQFKVPRYSRLNHALRDSICAKTKSAKSGLVFREVDGLEC